MMTENKRFTFADGFRIVAIRENGEIMNSIRVCDKLNELYEENNEFKINEEFKNKAYSDLLDNFTQLKKKYQKSKKENKELKIKNDLLSDELEQAKAVINNKWSEYLKKKELEE